MSGFRRIQQQPPWEQYLDEAADAGYEWTELGPIGYLPTDTDVLQAELEKRSLKLCGGFIMHHLEEEGAADQVLRRHRPRVRAVSSKLGARFIVLIDDVYTNLHTGERERPKELDDAAWARLIETTNRAQERAASYGLQVVFHPHADTHVENHRQMERLLADADPSVMMCLDTGHDAYTGGDPIAFFEKHHERIPYLHLKSIRGELREQVLRDGTPFAAAVATGDVLRTVRGRGRLRAPARRRSSHRLRRFRGGGAGHVSPGARRALSDRQADQGVPPGHRSGLAPQTHLSARGLDPERLTRRIGPPLNVARRHGILIVRPETGADQPGGAVR